VMPFVLRRTKDQVLKDLPPKIIQDIFVDLSPHQKRLYDAFEVLSDPGQSQLTPADPGQPTSDVRVSLGRNLPSLLPNTCTSTARVT